MSIEISDKEYGRNWTPEEVGEFVRKTYNRDAILLTLLNFAASQMKHRCVLIVGTDSVQGHCVADWPGMPEVEELRKIRAPIDTAANLHSNGFLQGTAESLGLKTWFDNVKVQPPSLLACVPIPIGGRVAIALVGDPLPAADIDSLGTIGNVIGTQLEHLIKLAKSGTLPAAADRIPEIPESAKKRLTKTADDSSVFPFAEAHSEHSVETSQVADQSGEGNRSALRGFPFAEAQSESVSEDFARKDEGQTHGKHKPMAALAEALLAQADTRGSDLRVEAAASVLADDPDSTTLRGRTMTGASEVSPQESEEQPAEEPDAEDESEGPATLHGYSIPGASEVSQILESSQEPEGPGDDSAAQGKSGAPEEREEPDPVTSHGYSSPSASEVGQILDSPQESKEPAEPASDDLEDRDTIRGFSMSAAGMFDDELAPDEAEPEAAKQPEAEKEAAEDQRSVATVPSNVTAFGLPLATPTVRTPVISASSTVFGLPLMNVDDSAESLVSQTVDPEPVEAHEPEAQPEPEVPEAQPEPEAQSPDAQDPNAQPESVEASEPAGNHPLSESSAQEFVGIIAENDVVLMAPQEIGDETSNRTLMGGIEAQTKMQQVIAERVGADTMRGGIESIAFEKSEPEATPEPAESERGVIPGALILRGARKVPRRQGRQDTIKDVPAPTAPMTGSGTSPMTVSGTSRGAPVPPRTAGQTLELGREPSNSTRMGMIDDWPVADAPDDAADDWLDDFADDHPSSGGKVSAATDRTRIPTPAKLDKDDPRTIPPEALERILESGPLDIEIQESFMLLDSRDQRVAFQAAENVAMAGEPVLEGLAAMFPGRLFVDRYQFTADTLPSVGDHGPVLRALVRLGTASLPVIQSFIDHTSAEARFYAIFLLTQISAEGLLPHLMPRLFDRDQQIRQITRSIALSYQNAPNFGSAILQPLHERLKLAQDELQIDVCTEVLTRLRNVDAIPLLIEQLGRHREHTNRNVHQALQVLTLHNWSSPYEWKNWWTTAQYESRRVWLVGAMDSQNDSVRQMASDELQRVPGLETAYHPEQPAKLRQREQRVVEKWFSEHS